MKKILSIITLTLAGAISAFAISDAQKEAFLGALNDTFLTSTQTNYQQKLADTYTAMKPTTDVVADWALENPVEYYNWAKALSNNSNIQWIVRYNIRQRTPSVVFTELQDFAINDCENKNLSAKADRIVYEALKSSNWSLQGIEFSKWKMMILAAVVYKDVAYLDTLDTNLLADWFNDYLTAVEASLVNADAETTWKKYIAVRKRFTPYQSKVKVKDSWARLLADEDSAYVDYKRSK